ncbi:hypothetical protein L228DRAFT_246686 [Xylona heveae TC161]|uniref:Oxidoreductase AflY n=1 Tax=Xylona heveae (strain CBS 132557 / TC161) TaxID=1328760 RepID=A0A165HQK4_XYLHT|nr:hypothetical protein L228DRAFT_246686 [Xylona heveae TC161]KZF23838.1 hypothetical protein L228DRAFT_246686 [Xylona heveae TC161]
MSIIPSFPNPLKLLKLFTSAPPPAIDLPSVEIYEIETSPEKSPRTLKHLLRLNHANHAILYHNLQFHNHLPHILGSAYILGAGPLQLGNIYDEESKTLEKWEDSPNEVSRHDWRDYLGDKRFQRSYVDFFEDELVRLGYDWRNVVAEYLFKGKEPLINGMIGGLGHPLIHLGYAFELSSRELGMEALSLTATNYNFLHKYLDKASSYSTNPSLSSPGATHTSTSPLEILERVRADKRFDGLFESRGSNNIQTLFDEREAAVLEYWTSWSIQDPIKQFKDSQRAAAAILVATDRAANHHHTFDFFLVHLLTTSHAVRILLPFIPAKFHIPLVRQWWLFTLAVYIAQLRPEIKLDRINDYDLAGRDWKWAVDQAVGGKHALDAHYVKAIRAMKEAAHTWTDHDQFYLKAAVQFADEFESWGGFGPESASDVEIYDKQH